jgi:hypothetical protein
MSNNHTIPDGVEVVRVDIPVNEFVHIAEIGVSYEIDKVFVKGEIVGDEHAQQLLKVAKKAYQEYYKYIETLEK